MSFPTDWDVEAYRTDHESDEHWELRKNFMEAHKEDYPEEKLVCLAQVFTNVEFLGCRYPEETMQLVATLSQNVAADFREQRKSKLQRTFVKASDAAGAKAKGTRNIGTKTQAFVTSTDDGPPNKIPKIEQTNLNEAINNTNVNDVKLSRKERKLLKQKQRDLDDNLDVVLPGGRWPGLIIVEPADESTAPASVLTTSLSKCAAFGLIGKWKSNKVLDKETPGSAAVYNVSYLINGEEVASATGCNIKTTRHLAAENALKELKKHCYTIKVKRSFFSEKTVDKKLAYKNTLETEGIGNENVGNKMMRLMGWSGGGLGKNQQGRTDNVAVNENIRRQGLGSADTKSFHKKAAAVLRDFIKGKLGPDDLVFSAEFSKSERKSLHQIAVSMNLQSHSHGKDNNRQLVISYKEPTWKILQDLLKGENGIKYELVHPTEN